MVLSCGLLGFGTPAGAGERPSGGSFVPADGRINTPHFTTKVTSVAWPATINGQQPSPGRRFVSFTLEVSALSQSTSPTAPAPDLTAAVRWRGTSHPLSLSSIIDRIQSGAAFSSTPSASASYMADVPNGTHDVDLVLSEGTFSQSFDLWTLRRVPPSPAVLYRDPAQTTIAGSAAGPATLTLSNPSDGFTNSASVTLQSATLGYVAPSGTTLTPAPDQAVLSVVLDAEHPNDPNDPTGSGHYLGAQAPLPAAMLNFTPSNAGVVPATISDMGDTNGKGSSDDGLFDATYSFLVPATLTSGTLQIAAGSFSGVEFTLYTAESGTTTLGITAPASLALTFPALQAAVSQSKPPWVGLPNPPTSAASSTSPASHGTGSGGFPIWAAVVILLALAAAAALIERWRRSRLSTAAEAPVATTSAAAEKAADPIIDAVVPTGNAGECRAVAPAGVVPDSVVFAEPAKIEDDSAVHVMGRRQLVGLVEPPSRILEAILLYLLFHDGRHLSADQIQLGMWPNGRSQGELKPKTFLNYLSQLRAWIGAEHLPDAVLSGGYLLVGITTDWAIFLRLCAQADTLVGAEARALRRQALDLVRGRPFEGLSGDGFDWIDDERLVGTMTKAIVSCARALVADLMESGEHTAAIDALDAALRGARNEYVLWELGALALWSRGDRTALEQWLGEAVHHLEASDVERIRDGLGHQDSSEL